MFENTETHRNETWAHYLTKQILYKTLKDKGRNATVEHPIGKGITDVYDHNQRIAYEVQGVVNMKEAKEKWGLYAKLGVALDVVIVPYKNIWKMERIDKIIKAVQEYVRD